MQRATGRIAARTAEQDKRTYLIRDIPTRKKKTGYFRTIRRVQNSTFAQIRPFFKTCLHLLYMYWSNVCIMWQNLLRAAIWQITRPAFSPNPLSCVVANQRKKNWVCQPIRHVEAEYDKNKRGTFWPFPKSRPSITRYSLKGLRTINGREQSNITNQKNLRGWLPLFGIFLLG